MSDPLALYPLSRLSGDAIPYEVIRPFGVLRQDFTDVASAAIPIPDGADLLAVYATNHCLLRFNDIAAVPANGTHLTDTIFIPADTFMNIDHNSAFVFSVIGLRDPGGTLLITTVKKWQDTKKSVQFARG